MVVTCPILRQFILKMYEITVSYLDSAHFTMSHSGCYKTTYFFFQVFLGKKIDSIYQQISFSYTYFNILDSHAQNLKSLITVCRMSIFFV